MDSLAASETTSMLAQFRSYFLTNPKGEGAVFDTKIDSLNVEHSNRADSIAKLQSINRSTRSSANKLEKEKMDACNSYVMNHYLRWMQTQGADVTALMSSPSSSSKSKSNNQANEKQS